MRKLILILFVFASVGTYAQNTNDLLNLLISNKVISQEDADSLRADAAIKQQESDAKKKSFQITAGKQLQFSGYTQVRAQAFEERGKFAAADIRRARLDIKGNIDPYWGYKAQFDLAVSPKLIDAYAEYKPYDFLNFTFGQFKLPFSLENVTSSNKLDVIDLSYAVEAYASRGKDVIGNHNGNDIGFQVSGGLFDYNDAKFIDYKVGIFNGAGINVAADNNKYKDVVGRLVIHPIRGLDIGYSTYIGNANYINPTYNKLAADNYIRNRYGFDLNFEKDAYSLRTEFLHGTDAQVKGQGYYVQAGYYILPQKLQIVAKYDTFDKNLSLDGDKKTSYTFLLNYNFSPNSKIQAGYVIQNEETNEISNNIPILQLQIGF